MIKFLNRIAGRFSLRLEPLEKGLAPDLATDKEFMEVFSACRPYTMTSPERLYSLYQSMRYLAANSIPGDIAECGVWKGGSSMFIAMMALRLGMQDRQLWLFDTFEGMSEPGEEDKDHSGVSAKAQLDKADRNVSESVWCYSSLDEVKANMARTGYDPANLHFIQGKVEDTIPGSLPGKLALLRLDTDWFASTYHELIHLYPQLNKDGVLIIDDFGHWEGAKKAVLQYFQEHDMHPLLHRIDETGRILLKP
jgi:hypothetical protein